MRNIWRRCVFSVLLIAAVLATTTTIYWPALHGPFLLDDFANLKPLLGWLKGSYDWQFVVFGNHSGPLGRPVSMATFLLDAAVSGSTDSFTFKLTNICVHLACGLALLWLAWQMFRRWQPTRGHAPWFALALTAWWLWLPLDVDTVLYVVQRMAQLAALFMLLALAIFMAARRRIEDGKPGGQWLLWMGVPALTVIAAFSKENGVLALPLALVLEVFLFGRRNRPRPRSVKLFFALTVGLPILAGIACVAWKPSFITGGYASRTFTLAERLLTEPRVLWSYVQTLLVPLGPRMGFFQDNFPLSTSLWQPWTTIPAILAWIAARAVGWRWRRANPLFGVGVCFFLVGQAIESGPISLEIYFEHRNYLPSVGILLAVIGALVWAWHTLPSPTPMFRRVAGVLAACVLALFGTATFGHVQSWRNDQTFYAAQQVFNPTSPRLQSMLAARAMRAGNLDDALHRIALYERYAPASERATATLWRLLAWCRAKRAPPAALYEQLARRAHGRITTFSMTAFEVLSHAVVDGCRGFNSARLARIMRGWTETTQMSPRSRAVWRTRFNLSHIIAESGDIRAARDLAQRAWIDSGYNDGVGVFVFQLNGTLGDIAACRKVLAHLETSYGHGNHRLDQAIMTFRKALADGEIGKPTKTGSKNAGA